MRALTLFVLAMMSVAIPAAAQTGNADVMAPVQTFIDSFNKGDMAAAASTHAAGPDLTIVDEVAPYLWNGPNAFQSWGAALDADVKKNGITGPKVTLSPAIRVERTADRAYIVVPAVFTFTQNGTAMHEAARMTFVLHKDATGWLIHAWTWTGPRATAVKAKGK